MNPIILSFLRERVGHWVVAQVGGSLFVGRCMTATPDGAVLETTCGRQFAFTGAAILMACDADNEAALEQEATRKPQDGVRH